tara:strand:+ start:1466 stop:1678 length:213 start_codon:yes stop_codon:yes gene_type:complete
VSNVGRVDRIVRGTGGVSVAFVEISGIFDTAEAIVQFFTLGLAIFLTLTSITGFCPFYPILRVNTCSIEE